jgi:hypothetical protein
MDSVEPDCHSTEAETGNSIKKFANSKKILNTTSRKIRNRAAEMEQRTHAIGQLQQNTWTKTEKIK